MKMKHVKRTKRRSAALLAAILAGTPLLAQAEERDDLEKLRATMLSLIDTLVKNRVISRSKADEMMREAETQAAARLAQAPAPEIGADGKKIVRVPYVPDAVKVQMREEIKSEVLAETRSERGAVQPDSWLTRIQFDGDLRLRAEAAWLDNGNTPAANVANAARTAMLTRAPDISGNTSSGNSSPLYNFNTQGNWERTRVRARLGMTANVADTVTAGIALATGNTTGPTSTNQTMGQGFNKYSVVVDRAFIKYEPASWLSVTGGRMRNPYFSTDLVWADDLNFEGVAIAFKQPLEPSVSVFATAGWFPLSFDMPLQTTGRSLYALQGGLDWQLGEKNSGIKVAAALYDYIGVAGIAQSTAAYQFSPNYLASEYSSSYRQRGNTLFRINAPNSGATPDSNTNWGLASGFRELNLTAAVDLGLFEPAHVVFTGDLVKNLAFDRTAMQQRTGLAIADGKSLGFMGRMQVGAPKIAKLGDWNVSLAYRYLGSDAVLDAFTNSDFGLGGANSKGTILGGNLGIAKNTWLSARWMSSNLIDSLVPGTSTKFSVDLFQFDVHAKF